MSTVPPVPSAASRRKALFKVVACFALLGPPIGALTALALCEVLGMPVNFVAPAFGFQKNTPYPNNAALKLLIEAQWRVCKQFGVSIGFHSGSGKSAENYQVMGEVTGSDLEIKTSGRYT